MTTHLEEHRMSHFARQAFGQANASNEFKGLTHAIGKMRDTALRSMREGRNEIDDDNDYPTTEHAYQAAKTLVKAERDAICNEPDPGKAKKMGRSVCCTRSMIMNLIPADQRKYSAICSWRLAVRRLKRATAGTTTSGATATASRAEG
jgi:hypothetical protein